MILIKDQPFSGPSFNLKNRAVRGLWQLVWLTLFRPTLPGMHAWRCGLLRLFGAQIEPNCYVYNDAQIWAPWNLAMASQSMLGRRVICYSMAPVSIGARTTISWGVRLCTGSHDYTSPSFQLYTKPIQIGSDAWICAEAFLLPGVRIGDGAVIGARSVVSHDQPPWMVCAGHPCKPMKPRPHGGVPVA